MNCCRVIVSELYPDEKRDIRILKDVGLLTNKTVLAHCCHLHDSEVAEMVRAGAAITSCPYVVNVLSSQLFDSFVGNADKAENTIDTRISYSPVLLFQSLTLSL